MPDLTKLNHSEEQLESRHVIRNNELSDQEKEAEEDDPLVALAPDVPLPEEQSPAAADAFTCPLFQHLDELLSLGKISRTKEARLKSVYKRLHSTLKSAQASEVQLLEEAKRCRAALERLEVQVESAEQRSTSEEPESEVTKLRQLLLQAYNTLRAAEDTEYAAQHKLKCLREERRILEKENENRLQRALLQEVESETKAMQDKNEALRKEVAQKQQEVRSLAEDVESHEEQTLKGLKEVEDKKKIIELKEAERAELISVPDQVFKEIERKHSKREAAVERMRALDAEVSAAEQQVKEAERRNHSLRSKREAMGEELERIRARVEACSGERRRLLKELEVKREEEVELMGNRGILEMKLQSITGDKKHLHERQCVQLREINRQTQALKRMEHVLTAAAEQLQHTRSVHDGLKAQLDAAPKTEAGAEQRMELQREVEALKVNLEKQLLDPLVGNQKDQQQQQQQHGTIQGLLRESNSLREELHNLGCLRQIKAEERAKKHRELLRAEQLKQQIEQEVLEKDLIIMDHSKLNAMLQRRLSQYGKLRRMLTEERNKYVRLKQATSRSITELTAEMKLLENETEIQRNVAVNKDRFLKKARMKIYSSSKTRDKLRNDISKIVWKQHQINQEFEDNKLELTRLAQMIKQREEASLASRKSLEEAVQRRNYLGIRLVEHEEEVLRCHEKLNLQEAAITEGNMALETVEKEMRDVQLEIGEEKRQIELKKKEVPLRSRLEGEITSLQIELAEARDKTLQRVNRAADYKELKGKDPSSAELVKKIEQLEATVAERERQLLERELLAEQVTRLSKPLGELVDSCQQDRLSLAKKLNEVRAQIVDANQRLTAASALLFMKRAAALSLQREIKEKEQQMERCQQQVGLGLPPCPDLEEEWRRMLRDERRRRRDREERDRLAEEDEWNPLPNGEYTTAEPRPNAYLPEADPLPLPKPYGALAPFKPSQPGANMRHIRKPSLKSLEM